ncbi:hypothetical protein THAOC_29330 [Thalassiosira oceanica]|uniref:ER membrane protein complex subunit 10 n=1 Tax=Thalassiosira oceanica TaxID=159749 RepID=K0RXL8_THAOC|nr:hypothetical protein THAOC_29330 [Thalassiosira oceanica]|eukprot:EJK51487.1 hypothetical protein THAOC_29330 [Thalassiosira oceanica]
MPAGGLLGLFLFHLLHGALSAENVVERAYQIYQKLGAEADEELRGVIYIRPNEEGVLQATFTPDEGATLDVNNFDSMVESKDLYTIIARESGMKSAVSTSVPGCSVRRSNLREEINLYIGPTGNLLSVAYRPNISPLAPKTCATLKPLAQKPDAIFGRGEEDGVASRMPFKTTVSYESNKPMMAIPTVLPHQRPPPGLKWFRRNSNNTPDPNIGGQTTHKDGGVPYPDEEQPSRWKSSFFYRYWYIVLPMALMGLFGGVDEEELKKHQQSQAAGGGAGAAATASTSHRQGRRRGKRD